MVMQMTEDKCYPGRGKWVKIPLLPENEDKRSLNYLGTLGNPWEGNNKYEMVKTGDMHTPSPWLLDSIKEWPSIKN